MAILAKPDGLRIPNGATCTTSLPARAGTLQNAASPPPVRSQRLMCVEVPPAAVSSPGMMLLFSPPEHPFKSGGDRFGSTTRKRHASFQKELIGIEQRTNCQFRGIWRTGPFLVLQRDGSPLCVADNVHAGKIEVYGMAAPACDTFPSAHKPQSDLNHSCITRPLTRNLALRTIGACPDGFSDDRGGAGFSPSPDYYPIDEHLREEATNVYDRARGAAKMA